MTTNVIHAFCRDCGNGVEADARFCGACGAPVTVASAPPEANGISYGSYAEVPWFRRRWFAVVCLLIFTPALLFLLATGDIYLEDNGQVRPVGKVAKYVLMGLGALTLARVVAAFIN